jgi:hypothetical protein
MCGLGAQERHMCAHDAHALPTCAQKPDARNGLWVSGFWTSALLTKSTPPALRSWFATFDGMGRVSDGQGRVPDSLENGMPCSS